jgi:hypothetical protein
MSGCWRNKILFKKIIRGLRPLQFFDKLRDFHSSDRHARRRIAYYIKVIKGLPLSLLVLCCGHTSIGDSRCGLLYFGPCERLGMFVGLGWNLYLYPTYLFVFGMGLCSLVLLGVTIGWQFEVDNVLGGFCPQLACLTGSVSEFRVICVYFCL